MCTVHGLACYVEQGTKQEYNGLDMLCNSKLMSVMLAKKLWSKQVTSGIEETLYFHSNTPIEQTSTTRLVSKE